MTPDEEKANEELIEASERLLVTARDWLEAIQKLKRDHAEEYKEYLAAMAPHEEELKELLEGVELIANGRQRF